MISNNRYNTFVDVFCEDTERLWIWCWFARNHGKLRIPIHYVFSTSFVSCLRIHGLEPSLCFYFRRVQNEFKMSTRPTRRQRPRMVGQQIRCLQLIATRDQMTDDAGEPRSNAFRCILNAKKM